MSTGAFVAALAVIAAVIMCSTLMSGAIDRYGVPQVAVFLLLGASLGPAGFGVIDAGLGSPFLHVVATLSLTLVLFTDSMALDLVEVRRNLGLVLRTLGPGTLIPAAVIAVLGAGLLGLEPAAATILGAALASTDPVMLRGLLRSKDVPPPARLALRLESGLNDVVLLPVVMVAMALAGDAGAGDLALAALDLFVLGPVAGAAVGLVAIVLLDRVRRRTGVRRDYESFYSLGVAFAAFAAAEAVHGSGFLAAFGAGMVIVWFDAELCDCFVEYGETTAEMLLIFTFVLLGAGPIWRGLEAIDGPTVLFAVAALAVRPVVMYLSLRGTRLDRTSRALIAWYGPRGLSSLLLVLLAVFAGLAGAERLFALASIVVLASVGLHGGSLMIAVLRGRAQGSPPVGPAETATPRPRRGEPELPVAITLDEQAALEAAGEPIVIGDVRAERNLYGEVAQAAGAVRIDPDDPAASARALGLPTEAWISLYCA